MRVITRMDAPSLTEPGEVMDLKLVEFSERDPRDKLSELRRLITTGCNPQMQELAAKICERAGVPERDTLGEASAILRFVQAIPYRAKSPETFRSAEYTLRHCFGDCPQKTVLFSTLCESLGIPTELYALGDRQGLLSFDWFHVFPMVLFPTHAPTELIPAETTLHVPLGFDPLAHARKTMGTARQL